MGALWHPFSDMGAIERDGEFVLVRGEGTRVWDRDGTEYLDATAGLWFANVGHGRAELGEVAARQASTLAAYSTFGDYATQPTIDLAERLAGIAPVPGSKVFFTSGGSDSVETAAKIARRYWVEKGEPTRRYIIGREKAYHGMHYAGTALGGLKGNTEGYGELVHDQAHVAWDDPESLRSTIEGLGAENVAAFFCEPVMGAGGVYPPPADYLTAVRKICTENEVLFVADEVVTGYGRIGGSWFAATRFGLEPDFVTTAKGLTSGYIPMGAVLVAPKVADVFYGTDAGVWLRHGYTYSGHAVAAAVALANLEILEREQLIDEAARLEGTLHEKLSPLAAHDKVEEVRSGTGAVAAVQLKDASLAAPLAVRMRELGVATRAVGVGGIQYSPSFVMTDDEVGQLAEVTARALDRL
ncbi:aspartate aminotransferase family protein [Calidifontibacter sp. DB0510]|uniref:Aspartate aminotransferase family protein n=1 Tax=Metallococcus carri TaxID=1656884 RepID=A0A967AXD3_9MICO|nr:aminotransferase class III-fold pyridoxal phosphate-dependent enzyme [Metallococcus carri]NHN54174.1 aspartate aminotransferase family protein [Metallococcus carri]NOP36986.1 aspartate aminotransferase family protein [Calidifontibacter sp. DB2511S]